MSFTHEGRTYRLRVTGTCLGCGRAIFNEQELFEPVLCPCWDEPPSDFELTTTPN